MIYEYRDQLYPNYLKHGNAMRFVLPYAEHFCMGQGLDVGAGPWPLPWAHPIELKDGGDAMDLPEREGGWDFIFSSHCLEHLEDPIAALEHWRGRLRPDGTLFLSLPHPDMEYWLPQNCRKHLHSWRPEEMVRIVEDLGFESVISSERDLGWAFQVVGFVP